MNQALLENQRLQQESFRMMQQSMMTSAQYSYNNAQQGGASVNADIQGHGAGGGTVAGKAQNNIFGQPQKKQYRTVEDIAELMSQSMIASLDHWFSKTMELQVMYQGQTNASYGKLKVRR